MTATIAKTGAGTLLKIGDGSSPEGFDAILEVRNVTPPALQRNFADATHLNSPNDFEEFVKAFKSTGNCDFEVNFDADDTDTQAALQTAYDDGTLKNFQLTFSSFSKTWAFSAYVENFAVSNITPADVIAASVSLKLSGGVTRT
jgi:hypothetical protein